MTHRATGFMDHFSVADATLVPSDSVSADVTGEANPGAGAGAGLLISQCSRSYEFGLSEIETQLSSDGAGAGVSGAGTGAGAFTVRIGPFGPAMFNWISRKRGR